MKKILSVFLSAFFVFGIFAAEEGNEKKLTLSAGFDTALYPYSTYKTEDAHVSPVTGPYEYVEARAKFNADYKYSDIFSFYGGIELTPITIRPMTSISITPLPFLVLSGGGSIGTGWKAGPLLSMAKTDTTTQEYESYDNFSRLYYDYWGSVTLQFDTGVIWPGDWNHVLFLANYKLINKTFTGLKDNEFGRWQGTDNFANGWQYDFFGVIAWQIPKRVYRIGFTGELYGYLESSDYGEYGKKSNYYADFMTAVFSPMVQIHLTKKDDLTVLADFASRRAFAEKREEITDEPFLHYTGYEWYFRRFALSFLHTF